MDHGSGTSACVGLSRAAMEYLLRTLDPNRHPVVVMGDRADLRAQHSRRMPPIEYDLVSSADLCGLSHAA